VSAAREEILGRVRAAVADSPPAPEPARDYRRSVEGGRDEIVDRFAARVGEYRATVRRASAADAAEAIAAACREHSVERLGVPADLPESWLPSGVERVTDLGLHAGELDALDGALTGSALAIAETGTIVLAGGEGQGRRALTLVPDLHVCVVEEQSVVGSVPEGVLALEHAAAEGRPITLVSGPSATSDIELSRVEGVHGPRTLVVVLIA
jgi:L-lactate dehydrogenase complex protein LldG